MSSELAILAIKGGRFREAETIYRTEISILPSPNSYLGLGMCIINLILDEDRKVDEAFYCFEKAIYFSEDKSAYENEIILICINCLYQLHNLKIELIKEKNSHTSLAILGGALTLSSIAIGANRKSNLFFQIGALAAATAGVNMSIENLSKRGSIKDILNIIDLIIHDINFNLDRTIQISKSFLVDQNNQLNKFYKFDIAKSRIIYIILALLFGGFGVHNYYAGFNTRATWQLVIWILALLFTSNLLFLIIFVWIIVDIFTIKIDSRGIAFTKLKSFNLASIAKSQTGSSSQKEVVLTDLETNKNIYKPEVYSFEQVNKNTDSETISGLDFDDTSQVANSFQAADLWNSNKAWIFSIVGSIFILSIIFYLLSGNNKIENPDPKFKQTASNRQIDLGNENFKEETNPPNSFSKNDTTDYQSNKNITNAANPSISVDNYDLSDDSELVRQRMVEWHYKDLFGNSWQEFYPLMVVAKERSYFYSEEDYSYDKTNKYCLKGDVVAIERCEGQWVYAAYYNGTHLTKGFMIIEELDRANTIVEETEGNIKSSVEGLKVRMKPGMNERVLYTMYKGEESSYLGYKTNYSSPESINGIDYNAPWFYIQTNDKSKGWVHGCCIVLNTKNKQTLNSSDISDIGPLEDSQSDFHSYENKTKNENKSKLSNVGVWIGYNRYNGNPSSCIIILSDYTWRSSNEDLDGNITYAAGTWDGDAEDFVLENELKTSGPMDGRVSEDCKVLYIRFQGFVDILKFERLTEEKKSTGRQPYWEGKF